MSGGKTKAPHFKIRLISTNNGHEVKHSHLIYIDEVKHSHLIYIEHRNTLTMAHSSLPRSQRSELPLQHISGQEWATNALVAVRKDPPSERDGDWRKRPRPERDRSRREG